MFNLLHSELPPVPVALVEQRQLTIYAPPPETHHVDFRAIETQHEEMFTK